MTWFKSDIYQGQIKRFAWNGHGRSKGPATDITTPFQLLNNQKNQNDILLCPPQCVFDTSRHHKLFIGLNSHYTNHKVM